MSGSTDWRPGPGVSNLRLRSILMSAVRDWFAASGAMEVETPVLSAAATSDPNLHSLQTKLDGQTFYLHTSPEYPMKRLLAAGSGDIFQLCKVFRSGEHGRLHNPEFTMLEWYRVGWDSERLMEEVDAVIRHLAQSAAGFVAGGAAATEPEPARHVSFGSLFCAHTDVDPFEPDADLLCQQLVKRLHSSGVDVPVTVKQDKDALLNLALAVLIEPALDPTTPTFVSGYPASQASLARLRPGNSQVADRFELFWRGMEIANGFGELTDAGELRNRFQTDLEKRKREGLSAAPLDERLLAAMEHGLPDCSGVALGFDRLIMALCGTSDISTVVTFDLHRA